MAAQDVPQRPPDAFRTAQNATKAPSSDVRQAPKLKFAVCFLKYFSFLAFIGKIFNDSVSKWPS